MVVISPDHKGPRQFLGGTVRGSGGGWSMSCITQRKLQIVTTLSFLGHLSHAKKTAGYEIHESSWLFNRDPGILWFILIPIQLCSISSPIYPKQLGAFFSLLTLFLEVYLDPKKHTQKTKPEEVFGRRG